MALHQTIQSACIREASVLIVRFRLLLMCRLRNTGARRVTPTSWCHRVCMSALTDTPCVTVKAVAFFGQSNNGCHDHKAFYTS